MLGRIFPASSKQLGLMDIDRGAFEDAILSHNTDDHGIYDGAYATGERTKRLFLDAEPVFTIERESAGLS